MLKITDAETEFTSTAVKNDHTITIENVQTLQT